MRALQHSAFQCLGLLVASLVFSQVAFCASVLGFYSNHSYLQVKGPNSQGNKLLHGFGTDLSWAPTSTVSLGLQYEAALGSTGIAAHGASAVASHILLGGLSESSSYGLVSLDLFPQYCFLFNYGATYRMFDLAKAKDLIADADKSLSKNTFIGAMAGLELNFTFADYAHIGPRVQAAVPLSKQKMAVSVYSAHLRLSVEL